MTKTKEEILAKFPNFRPDEFNIVKSIDGSEVLRFVSITAAYRAMEEYAAQFRPASERPKIVCLCGSTKFWEWFAIKRWELEKQGIIALGINILPDNYFGGDNIHGAEKENVSKVLDELHLRKIDLADEVLVLNIGGYIGPSTLNEISYAVAKGKLVTYMQAFPADQK